MTTPLTEIILRLGLSLLLGGAIGYQREISEKPAGLRTHALVSLGSALVMIVSIDLESKLGLPRADVTRIAAGVVTGIGFLGAGAIIRQGNIVRGLTTAASIWVVSGVGLAAGGGLYPAATVATFFVLITLIALKYVETAAVQSHRTIQMEAIDNPQELGLIVSSLGNIGVTVKTIEIEELTEEGSNIIQLELQLPQGCENDQVISALSAVKGVSNIQWVTRGLV
ncbi:MAG: MgtC/SapB family protein [Rubrobacteridae bacterium]|nr:MgtC/SapB family protein [Rubrobacteridae bacterium]